VAALLANCGLYVPCTYARVPRYDNFFMRTSSHDVPSENKSGNFDSNPTSHPNPNSSPNPYPNPNANPNPNQNIMNFSCILVAIMCPQRVSKVMVTLTITLPVTLTLPLPLNLTPKSPLTLTLTLPCTLTLTLTLPLTLTLT
jgi:hypothetical protein